jgi:uncharacterized membrane protein
VTVESVLRWQLPAFWAAAAALLLAAVAAWQYLALRTRVPPGRALLLAGLRSAALGLVLLAVLGPQLVRRALRQVRRPLGVAIDVSRSMGLKGGQEGTRLERVQRFLAGTEFARISADYLPEYVAFADTATKVAPGGLRGLAPTGSGTDLPGALALASSQAVSPAALLVFSDGGHEAPAGPTPAPGVPLVFVGVGGDEHRRDLELGEVAAPAIAFAGQPLEVRVAVRATGLAGREVPLLLRRGAQVLASRSVALPEDGASVTVPLSWTPPAPGRYALTLELPAQEGEEILENNRASLSVEAVRDRIRVLFVTGSPTWNYRFLRGALKGDPSVDLVSFIILRTATDAVDVPQQELSLIPFPTQKIFMEELPNFDLLIFDNFAYQPYLPAAYLEKVREFVAGGGAFWMLGGPLSFGGGSYGASPLAPLLPLDLPAQPAAGGTFRDEPLAGRLTPAGRTHPIFQVLAEGGGALPPLEGYNLAGRPRAGAVVLAEVARPGGVADPLVVLGRFGKGRVMAVLTDSLWRWALEEVGRGRGNRAYLSFVRQALRWSVDDPRSQPVRVEPERERVVPGSRVRARIRVLGEDFLPAHRASLSVLLREPGGRTRALVPVPQGAGVFAVEAEAAEEGVVEIVAEASAAGAVYGRAAASVTVSWPPGELRAPGLNRAAVRALLAGRRGALVDLGDDDAATARALRRALEGLAEGDAGDREESRPLAEEAWAFGAFLAVLATEWVVRRRSGLD